MVSNRQALNAWLADRRDKWKTELGGQDAQLQAMGENGCKVEDQISNVLNLKE